MILTFTVEGPPQPKQRARKGKGGRWYTPKETAQYEHAVAQAALAARAMYDRVRPPTRMTWPMDARYDLRVKAIVCDHRRRDADNILKSASDALNGVLWKDDAQVTTMSVTIEWERTRPRTEVMVEVVT